MRAETTYRLLLDHRLFLPNWVVIELTNGDYWIAAEDSSDKPEALVRADVLLIERSIEDEPTLAQAYHWREFSDIPAYTFTDSERMIFKLKFCGETLES